MSATGMPNLDSPEWLMLMATVNPEIMADEAVIRKWLSMKTPPELIERLAKACEEKRPHITREYLERLWKVRAFV
jgi:hypothetical protein